MPTDPIVAEIHRIREKLWKECHGSAKKMAERQRNLPQPDKSRLVDPRKWKKRYGTATRPPGGTSLQ